MSAHLLDTRAEIEAAAAENRRRDVQRWSVRAVDKVLAEFRLMGFTGFTCRVDADGAVHFEGVGQVPAFLRTQP